jgi:hypothetical protein
MGIRGTGESTPLKILPAGQWSRLFQGEKHRIYLGLTWHDCIMRIREEKKIQAKI